MRVLVFTIAIVISPGLTVVEEAVSNTVRAQFRTVRILAGQVVAPLLYP